MHFRTHVTARDRPQTDLNEALQARVREGLHLWRGHFHHGSELAEPVDSARDHVLGDPGAPVVVVEYGCYGSLAGSNEDAAVRTMLRGWLAEGKLSLVFRHFPVIDSYPDAWLSAQAAEAADLQGRFWDMHEALVHAQSRSGPRGVDRHRILAIARRLGLDGDRLEDDMDLRPTAERIFRDFDSGLRSGVNGAPTFYVQGIRQDIESPGDLKTTLESALAGDVGALWPPVHRSTDGHVEIARVWHDGLASGDFSASRQLWADDIDWRGWNDELPGGGSATGRDTVQQLHRRPRQAAAHGFTATAHDYIQHGERVLVIGEASREAATGSFRLPYVQIWEIQDGKATDVQTLTDTRAIERALAEPAATERSHRSAGPAASSDQAPCPDPRRPG
jgi:protein-disulfide isomerase/ketosteroid isomerase-like protein